MNLRMKPRTKPQMKHLIGTIILIAGGLLAWHLGRPAASVAATGNDPIEGTWLITAVHESRALRDMGPRSLALDAYGRPHIAFGGDHLYYAHHDGSHWQVDLVDPDDSVGEYTSLALDSAGRPHISYHDQGSGHLKYAHYDGSVWRIEIVDAGDPPGSARVGVCSSLALAPATAGERADQPQISYYDVTHQALKLAWYRDGSWHTGVVDSFGGSDNCTALALDEAGRPHVSYSGSGLKYAFAEAGSGTWHFELVDSDPAIGGPTSLALDSAGRPHISYCQMSPWGYCTDLRYAHHDGQSWQISTVDAANHGGGDNSLALDEADRPHISYRDGRGSLRYAYRSGATTPTWRSESVDYGAYYTALAIDPAGRPHISYYDNTASTLTYAYLSPPLFADPAFETVWQRTDKPIAEGLVTRSWMWGTRPSTDALFEPYADSPGGSRLVQYFDKSRMEINDPNGDRSSPWFVTNGLLVREMVDGWIQLGDDVYESSSPSLEAVAGDPLDSNPNCPRYATFTDLTWERAENRLGQKVTAVLSRDGAVWDDPSKAGYGGSEIAYYEEVTGHNVPQALWDFMNQHGLIYVDGRYQTGLVVDWLFAMGYPISEPYWVRCTVGGEEKDVLVQLFERRVLTYTPSNPAGWRVEMGNVGQHYYTWRYGEAGPLPPEPPPYP